MPSEEALRAAAVICRNKIWKAADRVIEVAEIIDREFQGLRDAHIAIIEDRTMAYGKLAEAEAERDRLREALGPRGRADCPKCQGTGAIYEIARNYRRECECRKELAE